MLSGDVLPGGGPMGNGGANRFPPAGVADRAAARRQGRRRRMGVRDGAVDQARTLAGRGAFDELDIGIDDDEITLGVDRGRIAEFQREIERFAEEHDQIGFLQLLREGAETRIVEAARAGHADDGDVQFRFECPLRRPSPRRAQMRPDQDQGPLGSLERRQDRIGGNVRERLFFRGEIVGVRPKDRIVLDDLFQHVRGQAEMDRPGAARGRDLDGQGDVVADLGGGFRHPGGFRHCRRHLRLRQFLETAATEFRRRRVAGNQHHGHFRSLRGAEGRDRVGVPGSAGDHGETDLAREFGPGAGHQYGRTFLAHMGQVDLGADRGVENLHDVVAGERENLVHSGAVKRLGEDVCPSQRVGHVVLPLCFAAGGTPLSALKVRAVSPSSLRRRGPFGKRYFALSGCLALSSRGGKRCGVGPSPSILPPPLSSRRRRNAASPLRRSWCTVRASPIRGCTSASRG